MQGPGRFEVPPQSARWFRVRRGQHVRVIDTEGQQVADMWACADDGTGTDWISTSQTRDLTERLFPLPGQSFYSMSARPLLTLVQDNSPCPHDMLYPPCDRGLFERAGRPGHPNCRDNFLGALDDAGLETSIVPDPVNLFQCSPPRADGRLEVLASDNPPGGNVLLRAETEVLVVLTACSVDFHPTNGGRCTALSVEIV